MGLQMGAVDHHRVRFPGVLGQRREDAVEHAEPAPAHEAVIKCLVRPVVPRRVAPAQPVADHVDDARLYNAYCKTHLCEQSYSEEYGS